MPACLSVWLAAISVPSSQPVLSLPALATLWLPCGQPHRLGPPGIAGPAVVPLRPKLDCCSHRHTHCSHDLAYSQENNV